MNRPGNSPAHAMVVALWWWVLTGWPGIGSAQATTLVHFGEVRQIHGAADLDLEGEFVYAINFSADDPIRVMGSVTFLPDSAVIPGAELVGPRSAVAWQTRPEFGSTGEDNQLEGILSDMRWADATAGERLKATLSVIPGEEYQLQLLFAENGTTDRRWDIRVGGRDAVDEVTSLGVTPGQSYARDRATVYVCQFKATAATVVIEMGDLFGINDGGVRAPMWQALTLERTTPPAAPEAVVLEPAEFFANQPTPVGRLRAVDRRALAVHAFTLVPGVGDADNAKFEIRETDLVTGPADFGGVSDGTRFSIRVRATDTTLPTRWLEQVLTPVLRTPHAPNRIMLDAASLYDGAGLGAVVARWAVEDPDPADAHHVELVVGPGGEDNGLFGLSDDKVLLVARPRAGQTEVHFRLRATDRSGLKREDSFRLPIEPGRIRLNEVLASEGVGLTVGDPRSREFIELANDKPQYVDLTGWGLTDDREDTEKWRFPARAIGPGAYLVVLADGSVSPPAGSTNLHANFSLSAEGEWLGLFRPGVAVPVSVLEFPRQFPGVAYGIGSDGQTGHLAQPTPGLANGPTVAAAENQVRFSQAHGFHDRGFDLELTAAVPGSTIRYTLDGTAPTATTGTVYTGPIAVGPATAGVTRGTRIVRALAIHPEAAYSPVATQTYVFVEGVAGPTVDGVVSQSRLVTGITRHPVYGPLLAGALRALPTVSVVMSGSPSTVERKASVELFDPAKAEPGFQIDCGLEATGTSSMGSPKLSLAAHFRTEYGASKLRYPVFARGSRHPRGAATEFDELRLRSHSHDTFYWLGTRENPPVPYGSPSVTRSGDAQLARNPWIDEMQLAMGQPGKHGRQVHLFLNGAYHGIYHIHEHADEDFLASYRPGASADYHFTGAAVAGSEHGAADTWRTPWNALKASLADYTQARRWVDVTNLCDYMVLNFYTGNDWDWTAQHNWSAAGPRMADRGGWKFFVQDSDVSLQDVAADCTDQDVPDGVFGALMRHADFRVLFRDRVYRHCFGDGVLTPARAGAAYDSWMNELTTAIVAETARWQPSSSVAALPWDRDQEWTNEWRYLRETFFPQRTDRLLQQIRSRAGWWPVAPPTPALAAGRVPSGAVVSFPSASGTVYYTVDGTDPRLPGGAVGPTALSTVTRGVTNVLSAARSVWRFLDDGSDPGARWVEAGFDDSRWRSGPGEIGYGDGNEATTAGFVDTDPATAGVQKNLTTYFRRTFEVPNPAGLESLVMRLICDDGAAVYLNGVEVWRVNLPEGPVTRTTRAVLAIGGDDESRYFEQPVTLPTGLLRAGPNVLAVEVHQQVETSSDISFDFELVGLRSGAPEPGALLIVRPTLVRARTYSGSDWSALVEAYYVPEGVPAVSSTNLLLTEIQYHPMDEPDAEFLEFLNPTTTTIDLSGVLITNAVVYRFPPGTWLESGKRVVVARDPAVFAARYGEATSPYWREGLVAKGPWAGNLSNAGERVEVLGASGEAILACDYGTGGVWPGRADGRGSSLELVGLPDATSTRSAEALTAWLSDPGRWRASAEVHGSPGVAGWAGRESVVINEVSAAPMFGDSDAIELLNRGTETVVVGGWFLSDSSLDYRKYRFPRGVGSRAGERWVLRETDFNERTNPNCVVPFALNESGDDVYLVAATPEGALLRFVDHVEFGLMPRGTSLGRVPDGEGPMVRLDPPSPGEPNAPVSAGYTAWAATAFTAGTTTELRQPGADPDGDGLGNFAEYAFVGRPEVADPAPLRGWMVPAGEGGGSEFAFEYRVRTASVDVDLSYRVEVSHNPWSWGPGTGEVEELRREVLADGATRVTARLRPLVGEAGGARFVRVSARFR